MCSTVGGLQYPGGYNDKCGGYLEYRRGCSVPWGISRVPWCSLEYRGDIMMQVGDIMMQVGDIMNTLGVLSTVGDTILCNLSTVGDIMIHVGAIMSTMGVFSTVRVLK